MMITKKHTNIPYFRTAKIGDPLPQIQQPLFHQVVQSFTTDDYSGIARCNLLTVENTIITDKFKILEHAASTALFLGLSKTHFLKEFVWYIAGDREYFQMYFTEIDQSSQDDSDSEEDPKFEIKNNASELGKMYPRKYHACMLGIRFEEYGEFHSIGTQPKDVRDAAYFGNLRLLKYEIDNNYSYWFDAIEEAIRGNQTKCLRYLLNGAPWRNEYPPVLTATRLGRLRSLKVLLNKGFIVDNDAVYQSIESDSFKCFEYIYKSKFQIIPEMIETMVEWDRIKFLQFMIKHDRDLIMEVVNLYIDRDAPAYLKKLLNAGVKATDDIIERAATNGKKRCLKVIIKMNNAVASKVVEKHIKSRNLPAVKQLVECGIKITERILEVTVKHKRLEILKYFYNMGANATPYVVAQAAASSLTCLKFLYRHVCTFDKRAVEFAAIAGKTECLDYLKNTCAQSWTHKTLALAKSNGHVACVRHLIANGCPK